MEFSKTYNRDEFLYFLRRDFLPDDFTSIDEPIEFATKTTYSKQATKLGICKSLDLVVYEIVHTGKDDPRVGLSKEAFRMLSAEWQSRALVLFVPENNANNYRFSLIEIKLEGDQTSAKVHRKYSNPRRYSYLLGEGIGCYTPNKYLAKDGARVVDFKDLENRFSIEVLTKEFYQKLYQWYLFAIDESTGVTFPNKTITDADDRENISVKIIRLITRVLFVWFIKQKKLVPEPIFDEKFLHTILKDFDPKSRESGDYYCAILQNLFFATINRAVVDDEGNPRRFAALKDKRDVRNLYRYAEMFSISEEAILELFEKVPFLNGGLFECLDKFKSSDILGGEDRYYDGFSRNSIKSASGNYRYRAFVPNVLFFNDDENQPGLLNLLKQYNFTIEENSSTDIQVSLDPELLGCVFENLLASFNPETQESARKSTGSFYTPRPVVEYMVQEALTAHLLRHCGELDQSDIESFFKTHIKPEAWSEQVCAKMADTLQEMKILDPACGSGAFPMGCLLSMMEIIDLLDRQNSDRYGLKLKIIENCIYGVDIQPIAMLITKLRFFISLICEQDDIDFSDKENNYGINTLPNLETKFVAANSLISADIRKFNEEWTNDEELTKLKDDLLRIRHEHFCARSQYRKQRNRSADQAKRDEIMDLIVRHSSTPDQKKIDLFLSSIAGCEDDLELCSAEQWVEEWVTPQATLFETPRPTLLRRDVNKDRRDELLRMIKQHREAISAEQNKSLLQGFEAAVEQVTQWNPYDQNSTSPFFDPEWMFGLRDGFDVVIGNPPYFQLQKATGKKITDKRGKVYDEKFGDLYADCGFEAFEKTGDIYCLFYEKGWQLLSPGAHLCYITSNKWMRTGYGESLRGFFSKHTNPIKLVDFSGVKVFESATVDTNVLLFSKSENLGNTMCSIVRKEHKEELRDIGSFVEREHSFCSFGGSGSWVVLSAIEQSIKAKIERIGTPLKDWDIRINYGIKTGCNEAFIISGAKRDEILDSCQSEDERVRTAAIIRPILRGRDIRRYSYNYADQWLISTHNGIKGQYSRVDIEDYPAIKAHLDQHWDKINNREDQGDTPYNLRSCAYWEDFSQPKIIWLTISDKPKFVIDTSEMICLNSTYILTGVRLNTILACLSSKLIEWYFDGICTSTGEGTNKWEKFVVEQIPVPYTTEEVENDLGSQISNYINIQLDREVIDRHLNSCICQLYDLSQEEIEFIESL